MEAEVQVEQEVVQEVVVQEEDQQGRKMSEIQIRLLSVATEKKKMTHTLHYYKVHYPRNHLTNSNKKKRNSLKLYIHSESSIRVLHYYSPPSLSNL
jgi:hypothetical protein